MHSLWYQTHYSWISWYLITMNFWQGLSLMFSALYYQYERYLYLYYDEQLWQFSKSIGQNNNGQSWSNVSFPYKALTSTDIFHKRRRKRFLNSAVELNIMSIHCSWGNLRANTLVGFQCLDRGRRFLFWVHQSSGFFNSWNRIL